MNYKLILALLAGSAILNTGCQCHDLNGDGDITDPGECHGKAPLPNDTGTPDPTEPDSYHVVCHDGTCSGNSIQINNTVLTACFSTNGSVFDADTPTNIISNCYAGLPSGSCTIPYGVGCDVSPSEQQPDGCVDSCDQTGTGHLLGGDIWEDPSGDCVWDYTEALDNLDTALATLIGQMDSVANFGTGVCQTLFANQNLHGNVIPTPSSGCGSDCNADQSARVVSPDMDYGLLINPVNSYVKLQLAGYTTFQKPAHGSLDATVSPGKSFLWGQAMVDNGTFMGTTLSNWKFYFDNPIAFTSSSGNFTVTPAAESAGVVGAYGQAWGTTIGTKLVAANNITGNVNVTAHTWTMTYSEVDSGITVTVHLEGSTY